MSVFDLRGNSGSNNWNYSNANNPHYSLRMNGTVVEISNPQSINYATKQPETWPDGNPKRNLRLTFADAGGQEWNWTFAPRSVAARAILEALDPQNTGRPVSIEEILGKLVDVTTIEGVFNQQHPRPWNVKVLGEGQVNLVRGLRDLSKEPAPNSAPQSAPQSAPAPQMITAPAAYAGPAVQPATQYPAMYDQDIPF